VVGNVLAVLFTSLDIDLITGPPVNRRRYLDITLSQVEPAYLRSLQRYSRVVQQRNSLLRQIDEGRASADQLTVWDEELITPAAEIVTTRAAAVAALNDRAAVLHARLSDGREQLALAYAPQIGDPGATVDLADAAALRNHLRLALHRRRRQEVSAGATLLGPHRDDLRITLDGESAAAFGSRAQQRTAALAVRLAEADFLRERSGESPVLLLDDILSELDERRRASVLATVGGSEQALITTADLDRFSPAFLESAAVYRVAGGMVTPLTEPAPAPEGA
jgi:DNA replication and repair protein RecF